MSPPPTAAPRTGSEHLRDLAARRLPEIDALIDRAQRVRTWLRDAAGCGCRSIDECGLFDDPGLPSARDARPLAITHVGGPRA